MVDIAPFRALRYTTSGKSNDISNQICPPYDVISPQERTQLAKKSKNNVVLLEIPSGDGFQKYKNASKLLQAWERQGVLGLENEPSFYLIETTYRIKDAFAPQKLLKRYGVMTALRLETPGKGHVRPHEKTLPKAKEDRLNLLTEVKTNVSPIFGLFFDNKNQWNKWIQKTIRLKPTVQGKEHNELTHRMWQISNKDLIKELSLVLKSKELYIADGHHRYEVAWAYREGRLKKKNAASDKAGWRRVMAYVCPMEEQGLLMLPTHRLVKTPHSLEVWQEYLSSIFDIKPVKNIQSVVDVLMKEGPRPGQKKRRRVLGWVNAKGSFILSLKKDVPVDWILKKRPQALKDLDVVWLHDLAMGESQTPSVVKDKELIYTRDLKEIQSHIKKDSKWVAFLVGSAGVESLAKVAAARQVMPPKTTYFYPKVPTGFTMMPLEQDIP